LGISRERIPGSEMALPPYRCVFLKPSGAPHGEVELVAENEAAAVALAAAMANSNGLELWDGPRLVLRLPPRAPTGSYGAP